MRYLVFLAMLLTVAAAPLRAQSAEEARRIAWTLERGRLLFELDRAAWVGTDDMMARIPDPAATGLRGYLVERDGDGFAILFYGGPAEAPVAFYRGRVENRRVTGREVYPADARPPLTAMQRRLAGARDLARTLVTRSCEGQPFNTVAIPPGTPDELIDLYLLTPQTSTNRFPVGGHHRFTLAADGSVQSSRAFTNSCLAMEVPPGPRPAALMVTHLLDPIPTEIHVFTAMTSGFALYVGTNDPDRVWSVTGDGIRLVDPPRPTPAT